MYPWEQILTRLDFATSELFTFICGSAPHTPENGRPTPPCGNRALYVIRGCSRRILGTLPYKAFSLSFRDSLDLGFATPEVLPSSVVPVDQRGVLVALCSSCFRLALRNLRA